MMNSAPYEERLAALQVDDRRLDECLAELDTRMSAWLAAVRAAHDALIRGTALQVTRPANSAAPPTVAPRADASPAAPPLDGEALLATLDEDTANAIRVKRRLTHGRRSVRDLLEELRSTPAPAAAEAAPAQKKPRWWRRRDE